ncbi:hypothetical protein BLOT_007576 [Blomia tropicalis]|nr:hypothetical protein BLOT_007576 [Blomia tropicalis]
MEDFNHNSTFTNSSLKDTTSTPMNTIIVQKDEKRNVPTQHMSQILIDQLHNNLSDINWNLADTRKYCTEGSSIFNCQLNWTMIGSHIDVKAIQMDVTTDTTEEHCFTINSFITCFHPFNGTHHEIFTYKLLYKDGTLDLESIPNYTFYPNYLLALTPQDFLLIFKAENIHNLADCCILSLYEDKCKSFDQLKKQKNIIT